MSSLQEQLFEQDKDEIILELDDIDVAKEAYLALGRFDDEKAKKNPSASSYQKAFEYFQTRYAFLSDRDKRRFEQWRESNGYEW